ARRRPRPPPRGRGRGTARRGGGGPARPAPSPRHDVGDLRTTTVRWLARDGKIRRELTGPSLDVQWGYVGEYVEGVHTIHGLDGNWKLVLPKKPGPAGDNTHPPRRRTVCHQYPPPPGRRPREIS